MPQWWPDLLGSWIYYSCLPAAKNLQPRFERIARFAPWIGLFIGGAQACLWLAGSALGLPTASLAALVIAFGLWLSGGLHFDGVLDCGDGLGAGKRQMEAMADSRIGASGLVAGLILLLLKGAALIALAPGAAGAALLWSAFWGRLSPLLAIAHFPYLRPGGSAGFHREHSQGLSRELRPSAFAFSLMVGLSLAVPNLPLGAGISGLIPAVAVPFWLGKRLGGHSGDSYGACVEWTEALALWLIWLIGLLGLG